MIYLEVLDRSGEVKTRHRLADFPATVGRAYHNDVIVDDPYVAPEHLRIEQSGDGTLTAVDLGSRNGLYTTEPAQRIERAPILPDTRLRIGHTQLRFRPQNYPVVPELQAAVPRRLRRVGTFYAALLAVSGFFMLEMWGSVYEDTEPIRLIVVLLGVLLATFAWSGVWAFAGKLTTRRAQFHPHATNALVGLAALALSYEAASYAQYALSSGAVQIAALFAYTAVIGWVLFRHIQLVSRQTGRQLAIAAVALAATFVGAMALVQYSADLGYSNALDYVKMLKPAAFRLVQGKSTEAFFARADALKREVDTLRDK